MVSIKTVFRLLLPVLAVVIALGLWQLAEAASIIDSINKWAWATNAGWINFSPSAGSVNVCTDHLEGYAWAENLGWIRLGTFSGCSAHTYTNTSAADYGVNKDVAGKLTGYAWSTNTGWIKFNPASGGVAIGSNGSFDGYAWSENAGWIHFKGTGSIPYNVAIGTARLLLPMIGR